ncbi:hypothetical protein Tco_0614813 [Tanacetum coccineum]
MISFDLFEAFVEIQGNTAELAAGGVDFNQIREGLMKGLEKKPEDKSSKAGQGTPNQIATRLVVKILQRIHVPLSIPSDWDAILAGGLRRMQERYTWPITHKGCSQVYGFWKHVSKVDMLEVHRLFLMFYGLNYQKSVESIPLAVNEEK